MNANLPTMLGFYFILCFILFFSQEAVVATIC